MAKTPKKQGFSIQGFDASHIQQTEGYVKAIDAIYNQAVAEYAKMAGKLNLDPLKPFSFGDYPGTKAKAEAIVSELANKMQSVIVQGSEKQWLFACKKNDAFIDSILETSKVKKSTLSKFQDRNLDALKTFQSRKVSGLGLSDRIWNYSGQMKTQMEMGIDLALGDGKSANALSRDLKQYLVDPDKLFRRVRDKHGVLQLSKNAKAFHPGQGKYRSSYKNAMRLTRSEINMAYRESDNLRWKQLNFVIGFEVILSNNHPVYDICDVVKGKYPKDFKFVGWHPQCRCKSIPILQDPKDFNTDELNELKSAINGTEYTPFQSANAINDVPKGFKDWIAENAERSKGWKSQPYFIRDNFKGGNISGGLKVATKTAEQLASEQLALQLAQAKAEALAAEQAIEAAKAKVLADKKNSEITYAKKKIAEAESLGLSSKNLEDLKAAIEDESLTYAQIAGKSKKMVQEIKVKKLINSDPLSKESLLQTYTKTEVDNLFSAYDNFYKNKIENTYSLGSKISKIEYEIDWLKTNGKYSTSIEFGKMLERDLVFLKAEIKNQLANEALFSTVQNAKSVITNASTIEFKSVKKATEDLNKALASKNVSIEIINAKTEKLNNAIADFYTKESAKLSKVKSDWSKASYSQQRKDAALWAKESAEADGKLRDNCGRVWNASTDAEKDAAYYYTHTYSSINEPLRGVTYYGNKDVSLSQSKVPHLTSIIEKSKYDFDMWVQRGVEKDGFKGLFGFDLNSIDVDKLQSIIGKVGEEKAFSSCGVSKGKGFSHKPVIYNVYCPKGTKMMYLEPFSQFGEGVRSVNWNGITKQTSFSSESEVLLQRNTKFRINKAEFKDGKYYIDVEVIGQ
jgi:hypothetical protein